MAAREPRAKVADGSLEAGVVVSQCHMGIMTQVYLREILQQFKQQGFQFAIVDATDEDGEIDPWAMHNIKDVTAVGMDSHIMIFPCPSKYKATDYINKIMDTIPSNLYGEVWINLFGEPSQGCAWFDSARNCAYIQELVSAVKKRGKRPGICTFSPTWKVLVGENPGCPTIGSEPLLYYSYDPNLDFNDFQLFSPWEKSYMKVFRVMSDAAFLYYE